MQPLAWFVLQQVVQRLLRLALGPGDQVVEARGLLAAGHGLGPGGVVAAGAAGGQEGVGGGARRSRPATSRSSRDARDLPSSRRRMAVRVADWPVSSPWRLLSWVRASSARSSNSRSVGLSSSAGWGSGMVVGLLELAGDQLGDRAALALDEGDVAEQRLALEPLDHRRHPGVRVDIG